MSQPEVPMFRNVFPSFVLSFPLLVLAACGAPAATDPDETDTGDTADSAATADTADTADTVDTADTADTGGALGLTLTAAGTALERTRYVTAHLTGAVSADGLSVAVEYSENTDEAPADCEATLAWSGVPATESHSGSDWAWDVQSAIVTQTGTCDWAFPVASGGLDGESSVYVGWYADYTDDWGDHYGQLLALGYVAPDVKGMATVYSSGSDHDHLKYYSPETGALDFTEEMGTGLPVYWDECSDSMDAHSSEDLYTSTAPATGVLRCDVDDAGDVYTIDLKAGDRLGLSADYASDHSDLSLKVAGPDGCLLASGRADALGSDGSTMVPSVDFTAEDRGTYTITVLSTYCTEDDETLEYSLAASVR